MCREFQVVGTAPVRKLLLRSLSRVRKKKKKELGPGDSGHKNKGPHRCSKWLRCDHWVGRMPVRRQFFKMRSVRAEREPHSVGRDPLIAVSSMFLWG